MKGVFRMKNFNISSVGKAEELIAIVLNDQTISEREKTDYLYSVLEGLLSEENVKKINGTVDNFHNLGVSIVKITNDYESALEVIQYGLKIHKTGTDLLADAIRYGYNCGKYDECDEWYHTLVRIPKQLWTWRAFSFSIDYLLDTLSSREDCVEENINSKVKEIIDLVKEYQLYFPDEEDGRVSEYEIYRVTNQKEKGVEILKEAIKDLKFCPKCWLRYADIMVERGDYEAAGPIIKKMRRTPESAISINFSYVYYLDGVCEMTRLFENDIYPEEEVRKVYKTFHNALRNSSLSSNTVAKIRERIQMLEMESEIEYPFDYDAV